MEIIHHLIFIVLPIIIKADGNEMNTQGITIYITITDLSRH